MRQLSSNISIQPTSSIPLCNRSISNSNNFSSLNNSNLTLRPARTPSTRRRITLHLRRTLPAQVCLVRG